MKPIAVYVHWPYCRKKCPYCDFNSHVTDSVDHDAWRDAYAREIEYYAQTLGKRHVTSIFFGGGTPSLMEPQTVSYVIDILSKIWSVDANVEITLEANPTSIEAGKFSDFRNAGVNRVSVGIQSLRDEQLQFLGREHNADEALKALNIANQTFERVSFDLIYARPGQGMDEWHDELVQALQYAKGHMSLYQLTIEDGTQFKTLRDSGRLTELDNDIAGDMYLMTADMMADHGMPAYEISNYAALGQESRHNLAYWRYADYVGIGPGAHGRITLPDNTKMATRTHKAPDIWMDNVTNHGHGAKPFVPLDNLTQIEERLMMGMRLNEGVDVTDINLDMDSLNPLFDGGILFMRDKRLFVSPQHWPILDSVIAKVLMAL
jgi:putative oxygen-independent coproporphyrinogen III oxidase